MYRHPTQQEGIREQVAHTPQPLRLALPAPTTLFFLTDVILAAHHQEQQVSIVSRFVLSQ